jgi:hypothetical protein
MSTFVKTSPRRRVPQHKRNGIPLNENSLLYTRKKDFINTKIIYKPFNKYFCTNKDILSSEFMQKLKQPGVSSTIGCSWEGLGCELKEDRNEFAYRCPRCSSVMCMLVYL